MAKQNVTFVERHLEKIILGVCGAIFLAICALYLVQSPHTVEVNGESLGPSQFYEQLRVKAEQTLGGMKNIPFSPDPAEKEKVEAIVRNLQLRKGDPKLPDQLEVAFVMPSPAVPDIGPGAGKKIELAEILPPIRPVMDANAAGRSLMVLTPPAILSADLNPQPVVPPALNPQPEPVHWIALAAAINRQSQRARFDAAGYHEERKALLLLGVEAQRETLLPSGEWAQAEIVKGYSPVELGILPRISIETSETGEPFVPTDQNMLIEQFRSKFSIYDQHQAPNFLRPAFQQELSKSGGDWWAWSVPRKIPGVDADLMRDYGVSYPDEQVLRPKRRAVAGRANPAAPPRGANPPRAPGRGRDDGGEGRGAVPRPGGGMAGAPRPAPTGPTDPAAAMQIRELMNKAEAAIKEGKYIDADNFLREVATVSGGLEALKTQAIKRLEEIQDDVTAAYKEEEKRLERRQIEMTMNFGPNLDPIWFTDITVTPGKTYRYRLRLLAMNSYAGEPGVWYLKNIQDATRVVLESAWSDWSDPITAKPDKQLFAYSADGQSVQLDLYQWSGKWQFGSTRSSVGEPVLVRAGRNEISYEATIAGIEPNRPYRKRKPERDGTITYLDPEPTHAVVLVNAHGEVEEHLVAHDAELRTNFLREKTEEERIQKELGQLQPGFMQPPRGVGPAPMPGMPMPGLMPPPGRFGGPDDMRRPGGGT